MTETTLRAVASSTRTFCQWANAAERGDWCQYHVGHLGYDRARDNSLHELSEMVMIMQEFGFVNLSQMAVPNDMENARAYLATRTGEGYMPRLLTSHQIGAIDYRALQAIKRRPASLSAARALRSDMALPETAATNMLKSLGERGLIVRAEQHGGWDVAEDLRAGVF